MVFKTDLDVDKIYLSTAPFFTVGTVPLTWKQKLIGALKVVAYATLRTLPNVMYLVAIYLLLKSLL